MNKNLTTALAVGGSGVVLKLLSLWNKLSDEEKKKVIEVACSIFYRVYAEKFANKKNDEEELNRKKKEADDMEKEDEELDEYEKSARENTESMIKDFKLRRKNTSNEVTTINKNDVSLLLNPNGINLSKTNLSAFKDEVASLAADEEFIKKVSKRLSDALPNETKSGYGKRAKAIAIEEMEKYFKIKDK